MQYNINSIWENFETGDWDFESFWNCNFSSVGAAKWISIHFLVAERVSNVHGIIFMESFFRKFNE